MIQLIYASAAAEGLGQDDIGQILEASRRNNRTAGLTGILLNLDQSFLQVLEGEAEAVHAIFTRIRRDPRHARVTPYPEIPIQKRSFGDWSMGYDALGPDAEGADSVFKLTRNALDEKLTREESVMAKTVIDTFFKVNRVER